METDDEEFVCRRCIQDEFLQNEIREEKNVQRCFVCNRRASSISLSVLVNKIHDVFFEEFSVTASSPEYSHDNWERDGESVNSILQEMLECDDQNLISRIQEALSNEHHSFEAAKAGEEDPYGDEAQYVLRRPNDYEFYDVWTAFETEIRNRARFFSKSAEGLLKEIFGDLHRFTAYKKPIFREVTPGNKDASMFRARQAHNTSAIKKILENPSVELGPPPPRLAGNGRMNPRWISMFYGAFDPDTCVAEIRAPVGSSVVIGKFDVVLPLRLLDLGALENLFVHKISYFDPAFRRLRDKSFFLKRLVRIMSRPILPGDEEFHYLPTQAVAEYLSEKLDPKIDGLIFPSSQIGGDSQNVALFQRASAIEPDGSEQLAFDINFGWSTEDDSDDSITIWYEKKRQRKSQRTTERPHFGIWPRQSEMGSEPLRIEISADPPALRLDLDKIEVRTITSVRYKTHRRSVTRYQKPKGKAPF